MRVGIDYRSALVNREGIGRYTRELVRGLLGHGFGGNLGLFGYTLAPRRFSLEELGLRDGRAELCRVRMPSRWIPGLLRRMGKGRTDHSVPIWDLINLTALLAGNDSLL